MPRLVLEYADDSGSVEVARAEVGPVIIEDIEGNPGMNAILRAFQDESGKKLRLVVED